MKDTSAKIRAEIDHARENARKLIADEAAINVKIIADAVSDATKLIASANESAIKLLAANAAEAAKVLAVRGTDDHDLLVKLGTAFDIRMEALEKSIKDLKDSNAAIIKDHDSRLDKLESWSATLEGENGALAKIPKSCDRLTSLENTRIAFEAQVKTWIIAGGLIYAIAAFLASKFL